jgi:hypothetical protein
VIKRLQGNVERLAGRQGVRAECSLHEAKAHVDRVL